MRAPDGSPSAPRTALRLAAELAGFAALLFLTRFVARGHLAPQTDQECHIGGIALDLLAHGLRFPLLAYAPNEYDNGSLASGALAAASFALLGPSVLALKLVTHLISAAGAVAALALLRRCLDELGVTARAARGAAIAALVAAIALAPRVVTFTALYAVGNHAEGAALNTILLAWFASRWPARAGWRTALFWAACGAALYFNKGVALVLPVLAAAALALDWRRPARLAAALGGLLLGCSPEVAVIVQRHGLGWLTVAGKAEHGAASFPRAFAQSLGSLAEWRPTLLFAWLFAIGAALERLAAAWHAGRPLPLALGLATGVTLLHVGAMALMAQGAFDAYAVYGYPTLVVLWAALLGAAVEAVAARRGERDAWIASAAAVLLTLVLYRPDAVRWEPARVAALWRDQEGAACSWRFAEGFEREHQYGLAAAGLSRTEHALARCRSLVTADLALDCAGGIGRAMHWRRGEHVAGAPPPELSGAEQRAFAFYYGTHRRGDAVACADFTDGALAADCRAAVQLDCLLFADLLARVQRGDGLGRPHCTLPEPPMRGYWAAQRDALLVERARTAGPMPRSVDGELAGCGAALAECYP